MLMCFEVKSKESEEVEVDFKGIIKGFLSSCNDGQVEVRSHFTSRGSGTYIMFYSKVGECIKLATALLDALLPKEVIYRVIDCGKLSPFQEG